MEKFFEKPPELGKERTGMTQEDIEKMQKERAAEAPIAEAEKAELVCSNCGQHYMGNPREIPHICPDCKGEPAPTTDVIL